MRRRLPVSVLFFFLSSPVLASECPSAPAAAAHSGAQIHECAGGHTKSISTKTTTVTTTSTSNSSSEDPAAKPEDPAHSEAASAAEAASGILTGSNPPSTLELGDSDMSTGSQAKPVMVGQMFAITLMRQACESFDLLAKPIGLQLNGINTGLSAIGCVNQGSDATLWFLLQPPDTGSPASGSVQTLWQQILGNPWHSRHFVRPYQVTISAPDAKNPIALAPASHALYLRVGSNARAAVGIALTLLLWGLLIWGGANTQLMRDRKGCAPAGTMASYSLSRVQMAWWFGIVFTTFMCLWVLTGNIPEVSTSALWLTGVAGTTGLVATSIDNRGDSFTSTENFFADLLTDASGVTLHRLQMLLMSLAVGIMFVWQSIKYLSMPELNDSVMALMGISSATYTGFKVTEKQGDAGKPEPAGGGKE